MKRIFSMLCFFAMILCAKAGVPTTDYLYATGLQYDEEYKLYYFDVNIEGENYYTAYGIDIQLPQGMEVVDDEYGIFVEMIKDIYPTYGRNKEYTHSVSPAFPYPDDHSHLRVGCISNQEQKLLDTKGTLFRVYVTIDDSKVPAWPVGAIKCYDVELTVDKDHYYDAPVSETIVPVYTGATTLPLKVSSAAKWSTCILPFAAEIPTGVTAYTCSNHDEEYIYLEKAESFEAYTPYILYAENGYEGNISGIVDATIPDNAKTGVVSDGYLNGAIVPQTATEGYVLQNHEGNVNFYAIAENDAFAIPAGKCWMSPISETKSNVLNFRTDDMTEGINNITIPVSSLSFDLNGRQLMMDKGVVIKNGKKTLSL